MNLVPYLRWSTEHPYTHPMCQRGFEEIGDRLHWSLPFSGETVLREAQIGFGRPVLLPGLGVHSLEGPNVVQVLIWN